MNILVGVDLSGTTEKIVAKAEELAKAFSAKIWLLHIADPDPEFVGYDVGPQSVRDSLSQKFHAEHKELQEIANKLRLRGLDTTALLVQGSTVEAFLNEAKKLNIDMIIVGAHGRGIIYQLIVGSTSEGILHKSDCPVLFVPVDRA